MRKLALLGLVGIHIALSIRVMEVSGDSMTPLINDGDKTVLVKAPTFEVGQIVVAEGQDNSFVIKRVYAKEGDKIAVNDSIILVNDVPVYRLNYSPEPFIRILDKNEYLLVGDNPTTAIFITNDVKYRLEVIL